MKSGGKWLKKIFTVLHLFQANIKLPLVTNFSFLSKGM